MPNIKIKNKDEQTTYTNVNKIKLYDGNTSYVFKYSLANSSLLDKTITFYNEGEQEYFIVSFKDSAKLYKGNIDNPSFNDGSFSYWASSYGGEEFTFPQTVSSSKNLYATYEYSINGNIPNGTFTTLLDGIKTGEEQVIQFEANEGFECPSFILVNSQQINCNKNTGISNSIEKINYDKELGKITLNNPYSNLNVNITCIPTEQTQETINAVINTLNSIESENETGAIKELLQNSSLEQINEVANNVGITREIEIEQPIEEEEPMNNYMYKINLNLSHCTTDFVSGTTYDTLPSKITINITPDEGYEMPQEITLMGSSSHSYNYSSYINKKIVLKPAFFVDKDITLTINCVKANTEYKYSFLYNNYFGYDLLKTNETNINTNGSLIKTLSLRKSSIQYNKQWYYVKYVLDDTLENLVEKIKTDWQAKKCGVEEVLMEDNKITLTNPWGFITANTTQIKNNKGKVIGVKSIPTRVIWFNLKGHWEVITKEEFDELNYGNGYVPLSYVKEVIDDYISSKEMGE